ncbi:hypothetical protein [Pseudoalteromonas xiamenensis]
MKNKGIALIQVLVISACLSVIGLFMSSSAKQKVETAQLAMDKAEAYVQAYDHESKLIYTLLKHSWLELDKQSIQEGEVEEKKKLQSSDSLPEEGIGLINFYGKPFDLPDGTNVKIQDLTGFLSINFPQLEMLGRLLDNLKVDETRKQLVIGKLLDWTDSDSVERFKGSELLNRNGTILDNSDFRNALNVSDDTYEKLKSVFTYTVTSHFNPYNSPTNVLKLLFGELKAQQIDKIRQKEEVPHYLKAGLFGISEMEKVDFAIGSIMKVDIEVHVKQAVVHRGFIIEFSPYEERLGERPYNIYERTVSW